MRSRWGLIALTAQMALTLWSADVAASREINDKDELVRRVQSALENRYDISRITMSPFALAQRCVDRFIFMHARDRDQQQALLTGRSAEITQSDEQHIVRCLAENGVANRR